MKKVLLCTLVMMFFACSCSGKEPEETSSSTSDLETTATSSIEETTTAISEITESESSVNTRDEDRKNMDHVNEIIKGIAYQESFSELSTEEKYTIYMETLQKLATEGDTEDEDFNYPLIIEDSITYDEHNESISFQYIFGGWGCIDLEDYSKYDE